MNIPSRSEFKSRNPNVQSKKFVRSREKRIVWGCILALVAFFTLTFAFSRLTHLSFINIHNINVIGADSDISDSLSASAMDSIQGEYLGLFSKSNYLLLSKNNISNALQKADARVNNVTIVRGDLKSLNIYIEEKKPAAVVCANLPNWEESDLSFDGNDVCYLVDSSGFIFMNATTTDKKINRFYIPDIKGPTGADIIGTKIATSTKFQSLQSFYNSVSAFGLNVRGLLVKGDGEFELYVSTKSNTIVVYFNQMNGFENQLTALLSFWNDINNKAQSGNKNLELDSIDLRYGSNVFYRAVK